MIIKLELNSNQLDALHKALNQPKNETPTETGQQYFVRILGVKNLQIETTDFPVAHYKVTLKVLESYSGNSSDLVAIKTPLIKLAQVLAAIGLFPRKDGVRDK